MTPRAPTGERFPKALRLLERREFLRIGRRGRRYYTEQFTVLVGRNRLAWPRLGITVSRQSGKSVRRNKAKRLIREFFRLRRKTMAPGFDLVVIVKDAAALQRLADVERNFERLFRQAPDLVLARSSGEDRPGDPERV